MQTLGLLSECSMQRTLQGLEQYTMDRPKLLPTPLNPLRKSLYSEKSAELCRKGLYLGRGLPGLLGKSHGAPASVL